MKLARMMAGWQAGGVARNGSCCRTKRANPFASRENDEGALVLREGAGGAQGASRDGGNCRHRADRWRAGVRSVPRFRFG